MCCTPNPLCHYIWKGAFREVIVSRKITRVGPRQCDWCSHTEMRAEKMASASRGEAPGDPPPTPGPWTPLLGLRQAPWPGGSVPAWLLTAA